MNTVTAPPWTLGDRIRKAREYRGWLQADLAERVHKARSTVSAWEKGTHAPSYAEIDLIARVTDIDVDWLQFGAITDSLTTGYQPRKWYDLPLFELVSQITGVPVYQ